MISKLIPAAVVGANLFDVRNCSDVRKNKEGIAELLKETAVEIMGSEENAAQFGGWTIDNTRTNKAAISILEDKRPDCNSMDQPRMCCTQYSPRHKGLLQSGQDR
jgi:hypothetical protein